MTDWYPNKLFWINKELFVVTKVRPNDMNGEPIPADVELVEW